jgi:hypothetical protein
LASAGVSSGQPRVENGQSPEENQVSSTSGSRESALPLHFGQLAGASSATITSPHAQCQAGIWWPHQSWRLMHQSWMLRIQWK